MKENQNKKRQPSEKENERSAAIDADLAYITAGGMIVPVELCDRIDRESTQNEKPNNMAKK